MSEPGVRTSTSVATVVAAPVAFFARTKHLAASVRRQVNARVARSLERTVSWLRSASTFSLVGTGLLVTALISIWTILLPQRAGLAALSDELAAATSQTTGLGSQPTSAIRQSSEFVRKLPARHEIPAILAIVYSKAEAVDLALESGHYEWKGGKDGEVGQYLISLPVHGSYPTIRKFIETTLAAAPAVALGSLHLARESVTDNSVDADVSFIIFVRES